MDFKVIKTTYEVEEKLSVLSILPFVVRVNKMKLVILVSWLIGG